MPGVSRGAGVPPPQYGEKVMNTLSKLQNKLFRPLAEAKSFLEKMPNGVSLEAMKGKVRILNTLNKKELAQLVDFLVERESVHVYSIRPEKAVAGEIQYLLHGRYGEPEAPRGFKLVSAVKEQNPARPSVITASDLIPPSQEEVSFPRRLNASEMIYGSAAKFVKPIQEEAEPVAKPAASVTPVVKSAAQMRKEAEELLRQAEEAERASEQNDFFKKRLSPIKLEVLQATIAIRNNLDGLIDGMAALEKATDKLKAITA